MNELADSGIVKRGNYDLWYLHPENENLDTYKNVRKLYQAIDKKLAEEFPNKVELSELSSIIRPVARAAKKTTTSVQPTEVQLKMLTVIHKAFGRTPFTPLAMGKAQGYTQAGWSKKYLETLKKKGFVEEVEHTGRGSLWQLTSIGVEWATR